ncbi:MAG: hypothetical protein JWQ21_1112 [Herminiimonas sp.]|nr:hypothetical protein [Herminiimonas sp.]
MNIKAFGNMGAQGGSRHFIMSGSSEKINLCDTTGLFRISPDSEMQ